MNLSIEIDDKKIAGLLCCGFEGGVGYWCAITGYKKPKKPVAHLSDDGTVYPHNDYALCGGAVLCCIDDDNGLDKSRKLVLNRAAIERGMKIMAEKYPRHFGDFMCGNEDSTTGDVFIQCCLLGEIVYG